MALRSSTGVMSTSGTQVGRRAAIAVGHARRMLVRQSRRRSANSARFASQYANLCGVRHHIRDTGDITPNGPVAVLLHGFAGSTEARDQVGPLLAESGCRAIAFDRVGFGRTERPAPPVLPAPPACLPFADALASAIESSVGSAPRPARRRCCPTRARRSRSGPQTRGARAAAGLAARNSATTRTRRCGAPRDLELLRQRVGLVGRAAQGLPRGHSAGGLCRRCARCSSARRTKPLPRGATLAGVALLAPASLDPREDADRFDVADDEPG